MSNLYQDAILDAKALRASAMANAKAALEEAFEPKIQEMIAKHLSEEEEADMEEGYGMEEEGKMHGEEADINEAELEEILNQLEEMDSHEKEALKEAEEEGEEEETEEEEGEEEEGEEAAEETEEVGDETKVIDITLGDLKQVIQSLMPGEAMPAADEPTAEPEGPEADSEEVSLDEILDELEAEGAEDVQSSGYEHGEQIPQEEDINEGVIDQILGQISPEAAKTLYTVLAAGGGAAAVITALQAAFPGIAKAMKDTPSVGSGPKMEEAKHKKEDEKKELKEAKATINALRKDLQEVNLLNAKYLYMNKLFKGKSLTEAQKVKVVNALDRATTVTEVKNVYMTLRESFETKKQQIKESISFASKPAGVAPKANIMEADQFISRWQKIAGIKK